MKKLLVVVAFLLMMVMSACTKPEFGSSINDLVGTEWSHRGDDATFVLKFYEDNLVKSFIDNRFGIESSSGTFQYIVTTRTLSFQGLNWFWGDTGKLAFTLTDAHVMDDHEMEIVIRHADGKVEIDYLYR